MSFDSEERPVRVLSRRLACQNTKFNAYFDHVVLPGNEEVPNYLTIVPQGPNVDDGLMPLHAPSGVGIVPSAEGTIGLLRVFRHAVGQDCWEVPRGFIDDGEVPQQAAMRELTEETGMCTTPEKLTSLGMVTPDAGLIRARIALFAAEDCRKVSSITPEIGGGQLHWFKIDVAVNMALASEILCAASVTAILRYAHLLRK